MISGNLNWKSQLESSRTVPSTFFISLIANKPTLFILLLDCAGKQVQIPRGGKRVNFPCESFAIFSAQGPN